MTLCLRANARSVPLKRKLVSKKVADPIMALSINDWRKPPPDTMPA